MTYGISAVQYHFHADFLGLQAAFFVEPHRRLIAGPHIQRYIVAALCFGKFEYMLVEFFSDMLPSDRFVYTEVINVKCLDIGQNVVIQMLLKDAEGITQYILCFIHRDKYGALTVMYDLPELAVRIFSAAVSLEQVRTACVVYHTYLPQKLIDPVHVLFLCASDLHLSLRFHPLRMCPFNQ